MDTRTQMTASCSEPRERASQALEAARLGRNQHGEASALIDLGAVHLHDGEYREALHCFEEALELARQLGDSYQESDALSNLGLALLATNQVDRAFEVLQKQVARSEGDPYAEKLALDN